MVSPHYAPPRIVRNFGGQRESALMLADSGIERSLRGVPLADQLRIASVVPTPRRPEICRSPADRRRRPARPGCAARRHAAHRRRSWYRDSAAGNAGSESYCRPQYRVRAAFDGDGRDRRADRRRRRRTGYDRAAAASPVSTGAGGGTGVPARARLGFGAAFAGGCAASSFRRRTAPRRCCRIPRVPFLRPLREKPGQESAFLPLSSCHVRVSPLRRAGLEAPLAPVAANRRFARPAKPPAPQS